MKSSNKKKRQKRNPKLVLAAGSALIIVLVGVSVLVYAHIHKSSPSSNQSGQTSSNNGKTAINFKPPTEEDKEVNDQHKSDIPTESTSKTTADGKRSVTPIISNASTNQVTAFVQGIFEDGGTCTLTLTSGSQTVTKTSTGFENASYTQCAPFDLSSTDLSGHSWSAVVQYSSAAAFGTSQKVTIKG
jgi:cytoskeletal protein RodZ